MRPRLAERRLLPADLVVGHSSIENCPCASTGAVSRGDSRLLVGHARHQLGEVDPMMTRSHLLPFLQCLLRVVISAAVGACIGIPLILLGFPLGVFGVLVCAFGCSAGAIAGAITWARRTNVAREYRWLMSFSVLLFFFASLFLIWYSTWAMTAPHRHFSPYGDL
jgi:hypothetical protein